MESTTTFTNPVLNDNRPDPAILELEQGFVVVTTSDHAQAGRDPALPMVFSKDLVHWEEVSSIRKFPNLLNHFLNL